MKSSRSVTISEESGENGDLEREGVGLCCHRRRDRGGSRGTERRRESNVS